MERGNEREMFGVSVSESHSKPKSANHPFSAPSPGTTSWDTCDAAASCGGEAHRTTERSASPAEEFPPVQGVQGVTT